MWGRKSVPHQEEPAMLLITVHNKATVSHTGCPSKEPLKIYNRNMKK
jgi:hypothetical protein